MPGLVIDPEKSHYVRLQHIAFAYDTLDDLLGSHARLKRLGIIPKLAADHGVGMSFYYEDPDENMVELNVSNYASEWIATEHMKNSPGFTRVHVDPDKMLAARRACRHGNCTNAPSPESCSRKAVTIQTVRMRGLGNRAVRDGGRASNSAGRHLTA